MSRGDVNIAINAQDKFSATMTRAASMVKGMPGLFAALPGPVHAAAGAVAGFAASFIALRVVVGEVGRAREEIDKLAKTARGLGDAAGDLRTLQFAMDDVAGMDSSRTITAIQKLGEEIGKAVTQDPDKPNAFKRLQLDAEQLSLMTPVQQFQTVRQALGDIENTNLRAVEAQRLFGKSARDIMPALLANNDAIADSEAMARRLGLAISDEGATAIEAMNGAIGQVNAGIQGVYNQVAIAVAPAVTAVANEITKWLPAVVQLAQVTMPHVIDAMAVVTGLAAQFAEVMSKVASLDFSGAFRAYQDPLRKVVEFRGAIDKMRQDAIDAAEEDQAARQRQNSALLAMLKAEAAERQAIAAQAERAKKLEEQRLQVQREIEAAQKRADDTISGLERQLAIEKDGVEAVVKREQLANATNEAERHRIALLQKQVAIQKQQNEMAAEQEKRQEELRKEAERNAEQRASERARMMQQIAEFQPGTQATESRLLTRGPQQKGLDKIADATKQTVMRLEAIREILAQQQERRQAQLELVG